MSEEEVEETANEQEKATEEKSDVAEDAAPSEESAEQTTEVIDWKDQYARLRAEFDNFKKRIQRDRDETYRFIEGEIIKDILPTIDNLTLALDKTTNKDDPFVKGIQLVHETLLATLKKHEAEPFDSLGKTLDVEKMEAIAQMPNADVAEGIISNEVTRGWLLRGKVLRVAKVVVSAGAPE